MLGYPHPKYLEAALTTEEISDWIAYSMVEPLPVQVSSWHREFLGLHLGKDYVAPPVKSMIFDDEISDYENAYNVYQSFGHLMEKEEAEAYKRELDEWLQELRRDGPDRVSDS